MKTTSQSGETGSSDCPKCVQHQEIIDELNTEIARLRQNEQINKETLQATSGLLHAIPTGLLIFQVPSIQANSFTSAEILKDTKCWELPRRETVDWN